MLSLGSQIFQHSPLSDDLRLLSVETEGWLSIHRVAMEDLFKIAKPHKINKVVELLEYKLAKALK